MSKKAKPQAQARKNQILDQQNEPFLKALQKRIRNINKTLNQIAELEAKGNLKPEQQEKVNRKQQLHQEIKRIQETAQLFRENYVENIAVYRAQQLKELEVLARAIVVNHSQSLKQPKLGQLWNAISGANQGTLNESVARLTEALNNFANDAQLQKNIKAHLESVGDRDVAQTQPQKVVEAVRQEPKVEPVKVEVKTEVKPPVEVKPEPVPEVKPQPPKQEVKVEKEVTPINQPQATPAAEQPRNERGPREPRGQRPPRRNPRPQQGQKREKKQYRAKYTENKEERVQQNDDESSESSPERRQFRKDEIRQLQEDGFTVVGKPKPKAKDPRDNRKAHERQHGQKSQHHQGSNR